MSDLEVTIDGIKAELAADPGFTNDADQCALYASVFAYEHFDQGEYESLNPACGSIDPATGGLF